MVEIGIGPKISELKYQIKKIREELDSLGAPTQNLPELIDSSNLIRSNEYLTKYSQHSFELIKTYQLYTKELEQMLKTVFEIQVDLKNLLKEQTKLLDKKSSKRTKNSKN